MQKELLKLSIDELTPYENNPRFNNDAVDAVAESIKQCEYIAPIIIDEDNIILAGHTRLKALQRLGKDQVDVLRVYGLTEEQKKKYRVLDNKTNEFADWDFEALDKELAELDFDGFDFGFELPEMDDPVLIEEDDAPDVNEIKESRVSEGDVYQLGRHRLMCGDSTLIEHVKTLMGGYKQTCFLQTHLMEWIMLGKQKMLSRLKTMRKMSLILLNS